MNRLSTLALLGGHLRTGVVPGMLAAALVTVTVFIVCVVPSALSALTTAQAQHAVSSLSAARRDLTATGLLGFPFAPESDPQVVLDGVGDDISRFPEDSGPPLSEVFTESAWYAQTRTIPGGVVDGPPDGRPMSIGVAVDPEWEERVVLEDGAPPAVWSGREEDPLPIAVSTKLAGLLNLEVGTRIQTDLATFEVSAVYRAADPGAGYWDHAPLLVEPHLALPPDFTVTALVYAAPLTIAELTPERASLIATAWWAPDPERITTAVTPRLLAAFSHLDLRGREVIAGSQVRFSSELPDALRGALDRVGFVVALLGLVAAGPLGVVIAVDAQSAQAILSRRRPAIALALARGASAFQLRLVMFLEGLLIGVPAAALGLLATRLLLPVDGTDAGVLLAALLGFAPAALLAALTPVTPGSGARSDLEVRSTSRLRWVAEAAAVGLAVVAVVLLFRRGFTTAAESVGLDPLLAAVPLLLAIAGCVLSLRLYPAVLLVAERLAHRARGPVALLGAARAVRTPALGFATGLALLVGVSISVFSVGIAATVTAGLATAVAEAEEPDAARAILDEPAIAGLQLMLLLSAAGATLLAALAVVLGSIAASGPRNRLMGVARVLGFSTRQLSALLAWELAPLALVAIVVGTLVGVGEVGLVVAALDLRPFLGTAEPPAAVLDPIATLGVVAAFSLVVLVAGTAAAVIARRVSPVSSIKMGAE